MTKSILIRRALALIIFILAVVGTLLNISFSFQLLTLILCFIATFISQNVQFILTFKNLDERSIAIKKDIQQIIFGKSLILILFWISVTTILGVIDIVSNSTSVVYDNSESADLFSILLPVLTFPICVALWEDKEKSIINPFLTKFQSLKNMFKLIVAAILITSLFIFSFITNQFYGSDKYFSFAQSRLVLNNSMNYKIIIDKRQPTGSIHSTGIFAKLKDIKVSTLDQSGKNQKVWNVDDQSKLESNPNDRLTIGYISGNGTNALTYRMPEVYTEITLPYLSYLEIKKAKNVELSLLNQECLEQDSLEIKVDQVDNLELPCLTKVKNLKTNYKK